MKKLIDYVRRNTPKVIPGYYYIKTQNIYIPFKKITIECLTRKSSELNLFFESILNLVDISVKSIKDITEILGVSISIVNEAIVDMISIDYIFVSEGILSITEKGRKALETRKVVAIQKSYLKDLAIDIITGDVYDADSIELFKPGKSSVQLEGVINIDDTYLDTHFLEINDIYQLQQKNNSVFGNVAVMNELYKIIGISYEDLCYLENKIYIYKSESSDELYFDFVNDTNDMYKNEFYNQLKDSFRPCQEYFFEKNKELVSDIERRESKIDREKEYQTQTVSKLILSEGDSEELLDSYMKERYSLNDTEYLGYLYYPKAFRYNSVCVCVNNLRSLLSNEFCSQISILAERMPVFIIYNKNEFKIEESLNYFFKTSKNNLYLIPKDSVEDNIICFDSEILMYVNKRVVNAFGRPITYTQLECSFNKSVVKDAMKLIFDKYDLNTYITRSDKGQRKNNEKSRHNRVKSYKGKTRKV